MEFACKTVYDHKTLAAMSKALRRTMRKKTSWCEWLLFLGLGVLALGTVMDASQSIWRRGIYLTVVVLVLFLQWKGDYLNAFFAKRKALPGTDVCRARFYPEFYETEIAGVQTQWQYTKVQALVETKDYIILILGKNQAQAYDKSGLEGRSVREFCGFLSRKTGLHVQTFPR